MWIRRFDYFRKVPGDLLKPTCCGAILSLMTIIVLHTTSLIQNLDNFSTCFEGNKFTFGSNNP
jgi:hypothetical protein